MTEQDVSARRARAVAEAMADIRRISSAGPLDRPRVEAFRERLLALLAQRDLFPASDFPAPTEGRGCLYRIAEDDDGRFALYVNATGDRTDSPVHDHTTWAVVCGFDGQELNRFFPVAELGAFVTKTVMARPRSGRGTPRMAETASGMLNSIGLQGPGIDVFVEKDLA